MEDVPFTLLNTRTLIDEPWLKVSAHDYRLPNKKILKDYYVVEEKNGITVVPMTASGEILIVKQFRPPINEMCYDLPGGLLDFPQEDPLKKAKQELLEETGYQSSQWHDLGNFYPAPHRMHNMQRCYLALNIEKTRLPKLDPTEMVSYQLVSYQELEEMIEENIFKCGYCITTYFKAKLHLSQTR